MKRLIFALLLLAASGLSYGQQSTMPPCLPSVKGADALHFALGLVQVPSTVSTRASSHFVWLCSLQTGYEVEAWIFSPTDVVLSAVASYFAGTLTYAQAQASCAANCWTLTASEQAYVNGLLSLYAVKATVGASGTAATRQVYNASFQPVTGESVAVGAPCNPALHIPAHPLPPPGTADQYPLYDVGGQPNASSSTGALLPAGSFAACNVKLPSIGVGNL